MFLYPIDVIKVLFTLPSCKSINRMTYIFSKTLMYFSNTRFRVFYSIMKIRNSLKVGVIKSTCYIFHMIHVRLLTIHLSFMRLSCVVLCFLRHFKQPHSDVHWFACYFSWIYGVNCTRKCSRFAPKFSCIYIWKLLY